MRDIRNLWDEFRDFLARHWVKGKDETDVETYQRAVREAGQVSALLDAPGWGVIRTRIATELLNELNLLSVQMRTGTLTDEALKMRTAKICAKSDFMEVIRAALFEGEAAREQLKKLAAEKSEQAQQMPSVESVAAQG